MQLVKAHGLDLGLQPHRFGQLAQGVNRSDHCVAASSNTFSITSTGQVRRRGQHPQGREIRPDWTLTANRSETLKVRLIAGFSEAKILEIEAAFWLPCLGFWGDGVGTCGQDLPVDGVFVWFVRSRRPSPEPQGQCTVRGKVAAIGLVDVTAHE